MTKDEMLQAARDAGLLFNEDAGTELAHELHIANLTEFWNAAMEFAACKFDQPHLEICGTEIRHAIRALKIKEGN